MQDNFYGKAYYGLDYRYFGQDAYDGGLWKWLNEYHQFNTVHIPVSKQFSYWNFREFLEDVGVL